MKTTIEFPAIFQVKYRHPNFEKTVEFSAYRESVGLVWNGYYKEERVRLRYSGEWWIVETMNLGRGTAFLRHPDPAPTIEDIQGMIQVACFFIDKVKKTDV